MGAEAGSRVPARSRRPRGPAVRLPVLAGYVGRVSLPPFPHLLPPTPRLSFPPQWPTPPPLATDSGTQAPGTARPHGCPRPACLCTPK